MLTPVHLRDLEVDAYVHPRAQPHLSAASGLVRLGRLLYVVADDEHHLGILRSDERGQPLPLHLHRLRAGDLPQDAARRKRLKPDLESLAALPAAAAWPHGALLAIGSGSRPNRCQAFIFPLDVAGVPDVFPQLVDLAPAGGPDHDDRWRSEGRRRGAGGGRPPADGDRRGRSGRRIAPAGSTRFSVGWVARSAPQREVLGKKPAGVSFAEPSLPVTR